MWVFLLLFLSGLVPVHAVTGISSEYREQGGYASWMLPARKGGYHVEISALVEPGVYALTDLTCTVRTWHGNAIVQKTVQTYKYDSYRGPLNLNLTTLVPANPAMESRLQLTCMANYSSLATAINGRINAVGVDVIKTTN